MTRSFAEAVELLLINAEQLTELIERGGTQTDLSELRAILVDLRTLVERDPGIEMAIQDLYASCQPAVANKDAPPDHRRRRLIQEARLRLRDHAVRARPGPRAIDAGMS
ncbi:MAG TPA: hypothetical protein VIL65_13635 [Beijerinckiaceae bacterium]